VTNRVLVAERSHNNRLYILHKLTYLIAHSSQDVRLLFRMSVKLDTYDVQYWRITDAKCFDNRHSTSNVMSTRLNIAEIGECQTYRPVVAVCQLQRCVCRPNLLKVLVLDVKREFECSLTFNI
jgi:hypothetical protein